MRYLKIKKNASRLLAKIKIKFYLVVALDSSVEFIN